MLMQVASDSITATHRRAGGAKEARWRFREGARVEGGGALLERLHLPPHARLTKSGKKNPTQKQSG